jgi:hypothetical protein
VPGVLYSGSLGVLERAWIKPFCWLGLREVLKVAMRKGVAAWAGAREANSPNPIRAMGKKGKVDFMLIYQSWEQI